MIRPLFLMGMKSHVLTEGDGWHSTAVSSISYCLLFYRPFCHVQFLLPRSVFTQYFSALLLNSVYLNLLPCIIQVISYSEILSSSQLLLHYLLWGPNTDVIFYLFKTVQSGNKQKLFGTDCNFCMNVLSLQVFSR